MSNNLDNVKEKFLDKYNNTQEISNNKKETEITEETKSNLERISHNEKLAILVSSISVFFNSFAQIYTKIIQKTYPEDFKTVPFLFMRNFLVFFLSIFHIRLKEGSLMKFKDIPEKKWFLLRISANFFGVASMTVALWYMRAATTVIIQNIHPLFILIGSHFILREKFYMRYIYGLIICFLGTLIILLNESKLSKSPKTIMEHSNTSLGVLFCSIDLFFITSVKIANKILVNNNVPVGTQMFYVGISTMLYSSLFIIIFGGVCLKPGFLVMCSLHGLFFYVSNVTQNYALRLCPLNKTILVQYLNVIYIFILSSLLLHETIFFTDILGASFILGFMIYNSLNFLPAK